MVEFGLPNSKRSKTMRINLMNSACLALMVCLAGCAEQSTEMTRESIEEIVKSNILIADWTGSFGGVPAFNKMDLEPLKPALEAGMALQLEEIDAITADPEPATFANMYRFWCHKPA